MEQIIELKKGEFWKGSCPKDLILEITCLEGSLWITQERDDWDYCLESRETLDIKETGLILVESLEDGSFLRIKQKSADQKAVSQLVIIKSFFHSL